jgi:hypothetical protein
MNLPSMAAASGGKRSLYDQMLSVSEHPWYVLAAAVVSPFVTQPSRQELIEGFMLIPTYTPVKDADGKSLMGEPRFPTLAEAERAADNAMRSMEQQQKAQEDAAA